MGLIKKHNVKFKVESYWLYEPSNVYITCANIVQTSDNDMGQNINLEYKCKTIFLIHSNSH